MSFNTFKIGDRSIGEKKVFVIAEIGNNHNGSMDRAFSLIDHCIEIGADCAKFQMRNLQEVYRSNSLNKQGDDLGVEYVIDLLDRFELSIDNHRELKDYCQKKGIIYLCTPWDHKSLQQLEEFKVEAYKVASADLTNIPLINSLIQTKKPLILSTGMSTEDEVSTISKLLNSSGSKYAFLHCNSTYPAPFQDINLSWMERLANIHPIIGYSGHERGISVSLAAVGLGAKIIERHITVDRNLEGPDHSASLLPDDFRELILGIRQIEDAIGTKEKRTLSQGEMINRENLSKSLVASKEIKEDEVITTKHIDVRSPGLGLSPLQFEDLVGRKSKRNLQKEDFFFPFGESLRSSGEVLF